jgi:hypothetical protein
MCACTSHLSHACHITFQSLHPWFDTSKTFSGAHKLWSSSLCSLPQPPVIWWDMRFSKWKVWRWLSSVVALCSQVDGWCFRGVKIYQTMLCYITEDSHLFCYFPKCSHDGEDVECGLVHVYQHFRGTCCLSVLCSSGYFFLLRSTYSLQHCILKIPQIMFFSYGDRPSFTPIRKTGKYYFLCFNP